MYELLHISPQKSDVARSWAEQDRESSSLGISAVANASHDAAGCVPSIMEDSAISNPPRRFDVDYGEANDELLIKWSIAGDSFAFGELVRRYQSRIYAHALKLSKCHETAEDIVQETFLKAYDKLHTFRFESAFYSWLFRISFNQFLADRRRQSISCLSLEEVERAGLHDPADGSRSGEELIEASEDRLRVRRALGQLDPQSRLILELREMEGHSYQEISRGLKLKMGTVRSRLARARQKLQRVLQSQLGSSKQEPVVNSRPGRSCPI
ncbi:MAG: sigma-70 family RNA polymerase sigma factor [bacterium]|nr:sigma-70 family RNA polymerase sigma factor [bacterium]